MRILLIILLIFTSLACEKINLFSPIIEPTPPRLVASRSTSLWENRAGTNNDEIQVTNITLRKNGILILDTNFTDAPILSADQNQNSSDLNLFHQTTTTYVQNLLDNLGYDIDVIFHTSTKYSSFNGVMHMMFLSTDITGTFEAERNGIIIPLRFGEFNYSDSCLWITPFFDINLISVAGLFGTPVEYQIYTRCLDGTQNIAEQFDTSGFSSGSIFPIGTHNQAYRTAYDTTNFNVVVFQNPND